MRLFFYIAENDRAQKNIAASIKKRRCLNNSKQKL